MDGKMGVGETLRETFAIYRDRAGVLLPVERLRVERQRPAEPATDDLPPRLP